MPGPNKIYFNMSCSKISPVFLRNIQVFCSKNPKFKIILNDINLEEPTDKDIEKLYTVLSSAFLEPHLTIHITNIFKNEILKILNFCVCNENLPLQYENHVKTCVALSKILKLHPDIGSFAIQYFEKFPSPFVQLKNEKYQFFKKSKIDMNSEVVITDLKVVTTSFNFLRFSPNYFRNKWPWYEFIDKYISHHDHMVKWICCQCIGIVTAMSTYQLDLFMHKILSADIIKECSINFELNQNPFICQDITADFSMCLRDYKLSNVISNIVSIGGINVPVYNVNVKSKIKIVEVESTTNNLKRIAMGILCDKAINLLGPVGCGKSVLIEYVAEKTGRILGEDFIKVQLGDQTDSKMLLGTYRCTDIPGEFVWQPGVLTQAVMDGSWLLLEDIDSASTDIASVLCGLLENKYLSVPGYRDFVPVKPGFRLFVTQRLISTITGYHKKHSHSSEILEKHLLNININPLSKNELEEVITSLFPKLKTISNRIVSVFEMLIRNNSENGITRKSGRLISTRDLFKWCSRAVVDYDVSSAESALKILQDAIDIFCSSQRDKEDRLNLAKIISSHLGIIDENAMYFCSQYKPNLSLTADALRAGRAIIKRINNICEQKIKFCFTRPSACLLESIMCCIVANEPVLLVGETGTGKTSTVQFLARTLGQEIIIINMNQQSDSADLLGGFKPVDLKFIVGPIRKEFENIFCSYFNVELNKKFLGHIAYCFNNKLYSELIVLMKKSYEAALKRLSTQNDDLIIGRKRKKGNESRRDDVDKVSQHKRFLERWTEFGRRLEKLDLQLKHKNALAFTFIEGSLVKAVEKGYWVLLDEINLANAETLECLSSLLEGPHGSLNLLERGDKKPIKRHPNFTLFACMNPSTDVGKKDLPAGLRNRFTEFFVDELIEKNDLLLLTNTYLEAKSLKEDKIESLVKFYLKVRREAQLSLSDGLGHKPHFSLRSLCRALHIASKNPCGHFIRSLYEAFCLSFLTQLDLISYNAVENMIMNHVVGPAQEFKSIIKHNIPKPFGANGDYVQFEGYWIPLGSLEPFTPEDYVLTDSVRKNLKDLVRIVSIGQLPVLLQGDTSVGKTSLITYLAKSSGHKCVRINNHEHTDLQEYVGSYAADINGKLIFREGLLVEAMRKGHWIILDELNLAPSDVLEALNRVLDDNRELFIPETQEVVKAHPNFMLFATQNPPGSYGGRKMLSRAFRNRFVELHFNEIPANELEIILHQRCHMAPSYAKKMINVMKDLQMRRRGSAAFAGKHGFITLRDLFRWGERYRLAKNISTLYDWDQHIADEGYLLLAGKVRKENEKIEIADVINKFMKRQVNPELLFTLSDKTSLVTRPILERIEKNKDKYSNIVWTFNMRQLAVLVSKALAFHEPALLIGETGCGKTTICDIIAQINDQKLITVNCHMHTESSDFIGGLRPVREHEDVNKLFEWVDGPLIKAMVDGNVFLVDEISLADDSVLERLNSLLEPERTLLLAEKGIDINNRENSELIVADNNFYFIGTMNPGGDFGKKELSPALRNRFTEIWCEPCKKREDLESIINHNISTDLKNCNVNFGVLIMDFIDWFKSQEIGKRFTISIRDILTWVNFINICFKSIKLGDLYVNGACLTLLDSFGSGVTSSESDEILKAFRNKCFEFINKQLENFNLCSSIFSISELKMDKKEHLYGIDPFYIEIGDEFAEDISFAFDVPTIKQNTLKLLRGLQLRKAILLEGSPGVGKTSLVTALAKKTNNKIYRVNLSDQTDISDLFGADLPVEGGKSGQFAWKDGPLLQALKKGHWILLDELNLASQSVLEGLNACLDHRGEIFVPELGKTFYVKSGTKFFACQNPLKQGGSRRGLPKSFLNRFTQVYISSLSGEDYFCILKEQFPQFPVDILKQMVEFNERLTKECKNYTFGNKGGPWEYNLRDLTRWCEVTLYHYTHSVADYKQYAPESSVKLIYSERMRTLEDKIKIKEIFEEVFSKKISDNSTTVYVTKSEVHFGDVRLNREIDCNINVQKDEEACLILRNQLEILRNLTYCVNMKWMSIIVGSSGCGKTSVVRALSRLAGKVLYTLPVTSAMDTSDLLGGFEQTDYTRHLDDIAKETELLFLRATQYLLLNSHRNEAVSLLKQWRNCSAFLTEVTKNRTMTEETRLFVKKLENLSSIWKTLHDNETTSKDIKQAVVKLERKGRVLLDAVKKEGSLNAGGKFEWVDSVLVKCLRNGHWLVIDNVNLCSPAVLDRLNALLEPNGTLTISERGLDENEKMFEIKPHDNFRLFLTMDPKNGEISRAMRNRGIEIYLPNDYESNQNFDIKSLINSKGISENDNLEALLKVHNFISDLILGDKPNIEDILQSSFLISQELKRGIETKDAFLNTIIDIYYKFRSDYDFNSNDPLSVIKNKIKETLNEKINILPKDIDVYDARITLNITELYLNTDLAKIKQQVVILEKYLEKIPDFRNVILYYFLMHFYSISNTQDLHLRHDYLKKSIIDKSYYFLQDINEEFYTQLLHFSSAVTQLPIDRKWITDNNCTSFSNNITLLLYFLVHKHLSEIAAKSVPKDSYSLMKYSKNVKTGKIQDNIDDVVVREIVMLLDKFDELIVNTLSNKSIIISNEQSVETITLLHWRFCLSQLLTTNINKLKKLELKELLSNLQVHYKWFIKYAVYKVKLMFGLTENELFNIIAEINSQLTNFFNPLKKVAKRFRKEIMKPPPFTNTTQLIVIPEYHKIADAFELSKTEKISNVLIKFSDEKLMSLLVGLKISLNYDFQEIPENYIKLKEIFENFMNEPTNAKYKKSEVNYLLISSYFSLISIYQTRCSNYQDIPTSISIPCVLQGVLTRYKATQDKRLLHEITNQVTYYLMNNPSIRPSKYLKYKNDDCDGENVDETEVNWQNPILTYLITNILVTSHTKTLTLSVKLKDYYDTMELYNKLNHLLWKNTYQITDVDNNFVNLEKTYIISKFETFIKNLATSLNIKFLNEKIYEIMELCLEQIKCIEQKNKLKEETEVWCSFLTECSKGIVNLNDTSSSSTTINFIANCYITLNYLCALLNSKLSLIDPYKKITLRRKYTSDEIQNLEALKSSFQAQSEIYSNVEFPLCPILNIKMNGLREEISALEKEIAVRPNSPKYESLLQDINHGFLTILSPNKIYKLYFDLELAVEKIQKCDPAVSTTELYNNLKQANLSTTSIESFINVLNQYRYLYPDIIEPLCCNVIEVLYGIKLKISFFKKMLLQYKYLQSNIRIQHRLTNLMKFPNFDEDQYNIEKIVNNYMEDSMQNFIAYILSSEEDTTTKQQNLNLLKCAIQEFFNYCTTDAKYSQISNNELFDKFNGFIKHFIIIWNKQEEELTRKQTESEKLYKIKTKCNDKSEEEQINEEFASLFPTYFHEFADLEEMELKDDPDVPVLDEDFSNITLDDINFVYNLHTTFLHGYTKSTWLNLNEKHNCVDYVTPLIHKYKLVKLILKHSIEGLNYDIDITNLSSLQVLVSVAQKYGNPKLFDEINSPSRFTTKQTFDFYRDPNIDEVNHCYQTLLNLHSQLTDLLIQWPDHPTLQNINTVIEKLSNFDIASPVSKFLTGFEILLSKCHEWEENAHSGVSLQEHIQSITAQIITWRKMELSMWKDILSVTFNRINAPIGKWWCYVYQIVEQFQQETTTTEDLIKTLTKFIAESNLGEFENRLELLLTFHYHCILIKKSSEVEVLANVLWNFYHYYKQFLPNVTAKIREFRIPIEKKLKDYVKIVTWKDISYWSIKETLHKTHKTIHKHIREYEKVLLQSVSPFLSENGSQLNTYENIGIWDRPQRVSPKSYHYTMDSVMYIVKNISKKLASKCTDDLLSIKTHKYFKKSRVLCKEIISATNYPKLVKAVDTLVADIIETSSHLQRLEVDTNLPKDKQKAQAKNILQQKHRNLSDLFKMLIKMGASFKKGMLEEKLNSTESRFITKPIDLEALFSHLNYKRSDEKLLTMWDGCELYYERSFIRLNLLKMAMQNPSKDLGLQNIERCRGFASNLLNLATEQKGKLIDSTLNFYYFRYYLNYFSDFCNEEKFIHQNTLKNLKLVLSNLVTILEQNRVILATCPEEISNEITLKDIPTLKPEKLNALCFKHDTVWNNATSILNNIIINTEKILIILKKNKTIAPCVKNFICPTYIPVSDFNVIVKDLELIETKINDLLQLLGNIPLYKSLTWILNEVKNVKNEFLSSEVYQGHVDEYIKNIITYKERLLKKILVVLQNVYKKYKNTSESQSVKEEVDTEEIDTTIHDQHLKSLILEDLFDNLTLLKTKDMLQYIETIVENLNKIAPCHYSKVKNAISNNLLLLEQFVLLYEYFITQQVSSYRVTGKLTSVLLNIFNELLKKGFCIPPELSEELDDESKIQQSGGIGLGDGEGEKDVSERIESEDQLDDTKQDQAEQGEEDKRNCREEQNAIEMSEDFESDLQDVNKNLDENEESRSDAEEQMGETEKEAEQVDQQLWGSDDDIDEDEDEEKDEEGNSNETEKERQLAANENSSKENKEPSEPQNEDSDKNKSTNEINQEDSEYDDNQVDPYHGNQPELPEPEPMDLPDDIQLDEDEKANEENQDDNPFDIDTMKEQIAPEDKLDDIQEEKDDERDDQDKKSNEENSDSENETQENPMEVDENDTENQSENDQCKTNIDNDSTEEDNINKNEQSTLDQNDTNEHQIQPMDVDSNIDDSADNVQANQAKNQTSNETNPISEKDTPDKAGIGQSQVEECSTGHKGAPSAQQEASDSKHDNIKQEKRQKPGESDSQRSLGDTSEPVKKRLKTIHSENNEEDYENKSEEKEAEMYQHIKEAKSHSEQVFDVATKEQVEQQTNLPNLDEEESDEKSKESSEELPQEIEENVEVNDSIKQKAEKMENKKSELLDKSQHREGDIVQEMNEIDIEGEITQTSTVNRGYESLHHTLYSNLIDEKSFKSNVEDINNIRIQIEEQLSKWTEPPTSEEAQRAWEKISSVTSSLAQDLSEQLRLVLEPTQASRLRGDFKTGKRINMRKIIPYVASQFRKDKIWLKRTKPAKREYQIVLAIDDSSSMDDNSSKELAFESVALISKALTLLESGQLSVLSFGESTELLHKLDEPFTEKSGYKLLQKFQFNQKKTCVGQMVNFAIEILNSTHIQSNSLNAKLLVIISDGRGIFSEGETYIRQAIRRAKFSNIFMVFIIIDNPQNNSSILDIRTPIFNKGTSEILTIKSYMDSFPFPFYIILRDINSLPNVLSDALRQWFEIVSSYHRI